MEATENGQVVADQGRTLVLTQGTARRLYRLYARAEATSELARVASNTSLQAQQAFNDALGEAFEVAGIPFEPTDRYQVDWRESRVTLTETGAVP